MKILVVSQYYYPEQFKITEICEEFVQRGHKVTVITGLPNYPEGKVYKGYRFYKKRKETINGVDVRRCFEIGRGKTSIRLFINYISFWISSKIKASLIKKDFDLVFVFEISPVMQISAAKTYKKRSNKKVITYCQDIWPEVLKVRGMSENSLPFKYFHRLSKKLYNTSDIILVTSKSFINYLNEVNHISKEKIIYLPQHSNDDYLIEDFSKKSNETIDLLYAGNIGKMQNIEMVIEAINNLKIENLIFHIVGNGSQYEKCKYLISTYDLSKNIIMYGRKDISEIPNFYKMCDACILTLSNKNLSGLTIPTKMQDYMAAGKTILASIDGDARDIIQEVNCGLSCKADDAKEFQLVIKNFVDNYDQFKNLGENGRTYFKNNFTKKVFIDKLELIFEECIRDDKI